MSVLLERCSTLREMFESRTGKSLSGESVSINSNISIDLAQTLYATVLREKPTRVLEVGMAFGTSSLAILTALRDCGNGGRLVTIDPMQTSIWKGCGKNAVARAGLSGQHEVVEEYDYLALPQLLAKGEKIGFAYIDGWHTFDYTLLDFWYADRMLEVNGIIAFNDCGWRAVDKAIRFVMSHRKYVELDVGLTTKYRGLGRIQNAVSALTGGKHRWGRRAEDRYFRKEASWEPNWDFYAPF